MPLLLMHDNTSPWLSYRPKQILNYTRRLLVYNEEYKAIPLCPSEAVAAQRKSLWGLSANSQLLSGLSILLKKNIYIHIDSFSWHSLSLARTTEVPSVTAYQLRQCVAVIYLSFMGCVKSGEPKMPFEGR